MFNYHIFLFEIKDLIFINICLYYKNYKYINNHI